jgi:hypothetical protein
MAARTRPCSSWRSTPPIPRPDTLAGAVGRARACGGHLTTEARLRSPARLACWLLVATLAGCAAAPADPVPDPDLRILFIGNSLTFANDLPAMVQQLGRSDPGRPVTVASVAFPDFSLEDHWNQGDALQAINAGSWDFVVLQQGPSALPESRTNLIEWAGRFAAEIRRVGARPALYMVWPELSRENVWGDVTESYRAAAEAVDGVLLPAGEALRSARADDPSLALFGGDGFHPTVAGTYGAALVIYAMTAGVSPLGVSARAGDAPVPAQAAGTLERAAAEAIDRFGRR